MTRLGDTVLGILFGLIAGMTIGIELAPVVVAHITCPSTDHVISKTRMLAWP